MVHERSGSAFAPRVLFLDQTGQLGGAELMLADVAEDHRKHCLVALFSDGPFRGRLESLGVKVRIIGGGGNALLASKAAGWMGLMAAIPGVLRLGSRVAHIARHYDVIYANTAKALIIGAIARVISGRPLIFHLHDIISGQHFSRLNRWLMTGVSNAAVDSVIANSVASLQAFETAGAAISCAGVIYNGFRPESFEAPAEAAAAVRREFGVGAHPLILVAGRITPWKGQDVVLEALKSLPGLHVLLVGEALFTADDTAYAQHLRQLAADPMIAGRVHFAGHRGDMAACYRAADIVVHSSVAPEPFGRVVVEAMLAGRPVVATNDGGVPEIIVAGQTGRLVRPNAPQELAVVLRELLAGPAASDEMALQGKKAAQRRFGMERFLLAVREFVKSAAADFFGRSI